MADLNTGQMQMPSWSDTAMKGMDFATNLFPDSKEYDGAKGATTLKLDAAYDTIENVAGKLKGVPVIGLYAGLVLMGMKANKLLGKGIKAVGGGTDGMTSTDAILGSSFMLATPMGMINGFTGKKAETIELNEDAFSNTGNSYEGVLSGVLSAMDFSGKKYGGFSSGARKKANKLIRNMNMNLTKVADIGNQLAMNTEMLSNLANMVGNAANFELSGGFDANNIQAARLGAKMDILKLSRLHRLANGGDLTMNDIKPNKITSRAIRLASKGTKIRTPWKPTWDVDWDETSKDIDNKFLLSVLELEIINELEPTLEFLGQTLDGLFEYINPITKEKSISDTPLFKEGGSINVIPEGALHAHKHHMENDKNITKKGIPVVVEEKGGELNLQAEIERNEIIFRLEVTKKLEELNKKFQSEESSQKEKNDAAIEAGKLLVHEILYNTDDRTGLIDTILVAKNGGIL